MRIIEISKNRLYRVYNNGIYKDCWIEDGEIQYPENLHNILLPSEQKEIEMIIF
tara:strand:- start:13930 stop:14091 length:162 start_codon:yes stop_codon:yes gene_type:complete